jgi:hypothetical protein
MRNSIVALILIGLSAPAFAQQPPAGEPSSAPPAASQAAPAETAPPPQAAPATAAPARKPSVCRTRGRQQALRGEALRDFIQVCRLESRLACLKDAIAKKIVGPARRDYLKSCAS